MSRLSAYLPLSSHLLTKWSVRLIPTIPNVWFHVDQQPNLVLANQFGFGIWQWGGGVYVVRLLETWLTNECLDCVPSDFDDLPCCLWRQQSRHRHFPPPCPLVAWRHHQSSAVPFEFLLSSCCSVLVLISTNDLPKQTTTYLQSLLSAAESLSTYIAC